MSMCWADEVYAVIHPYESLDKLIEALDKPKPEDEAITRAVRALEKLKELLEE